MSKQGQPPKHGAKAPVTPWRPQAGPSKEACVLSPHLPQSGLHWHPHRAPPGDAASVSQKLDDTIVAAQISGVGEELKKLQDKIHLLEQSTDRAEAPAASEQPGHDFQGKIDLEQQMQRTAAFEHQMSELMDMVARLQSTERVRQMVDSADSASSTRAAVTAVPRRQLWSDRLDENEMAVDSDSNVKDTVMTTERGSSTTDLGVHDAALRLDAVLSATLIKHQEAHVRELKLAAMGLLSELGYRHAAATIEGVSDQREATPEAGDHVVLTVGQDDYVEGISTQQEETPDEGDHVGHAAEQDDNVGEHDDPRQRHSTRRSERPLLHTDLDALIEEVQAADAASTEVQWPIRLPAFWYNSDPKRAARAIFRHAHGRQSTRLDVEWWTHEVARPSRAGQVVRPQHHCFVRFPIWLQWFQGTANTAAEAERVAFRDALDQFGSWIYWDYSDNRQQQYGAGRE